MSTSRRTGLRYTELPAVDVARFADNPTASRAMEQVRQIINTRFGKSGPTHDRAVTWGDLVENGIVTMLGTNGRHITVRNPDGSFLPALPPEVDGIPPAPTNVTATAGFSIVILEWDRPTFRFFGHAEIFRSITDNLSLAVLVGQTTAWVYSDAVESGTYYYWVRFISKAGNVGPFNAVGGVEATITPDPAYLLELLEGEITESHLYKSLGDRIDLIDGSGVGSVAARIASEASERAAAIQAVARDIAQEAINRARGIADEAAARQAAINTKANSLNARIDALELDVSDILGTQPYEPSESYAAGDLVTYESALYRALIATAGNDPTNKTYWEKLGDYTSLGAAVGDLSSRIVGVESVTADQAMILDMVETVDGPISNTIKALQTTTADHASRLTTLQSTSGENTSAITRLESTDEAQAARITTLETTDGEHTGKITLLELTTADQASTLATLQAGQADHKSLITALNDVTAEQATSLFTLTTSDADHTAQIKNLLQTGVDQAVRIDSLEVSGEESVAAISNLESVATAYAERLTSIETTAGDHTSQITLLQRTDLDQAIVLEQLATRAEDSETSISELLLTTAGQATRLVTLDAASLSHSSGIENLDEVTAEQALQLTSITTRVGETEAGLISLSATSADSVLKIDSLYVSDDETNARIDIEAQISNAKDVLLASTSQYLVSRTGANEAAIANEARVRTDEYTSLAELITRLQAVAGENTSAIEIESLTRANQTGDLSAKITVKIDQNGYVSGYGLASTANDSTPTSEFAVRADRFYIASPTGPGIPPTIPFTVQTVATTINGVAVSVGMYVNDAFIKNGTITRVKIGNAAIDDAKIESLSAVKITFGEMSGDRISANSLDADRITVNSLAARLAYITTAYIDEANINTAAVTTAKIANAAITAAKIAYATITAAEIADAAITNAKISGDIWSNSWTGWGGAGWHLGQAGRAHFNDAHIRGSLSAVTGTFSGSLTAQAVNAVDRINIAGNAVTVHMSSSAESPAIVGAGQFWHTYLHHPLGIPSAGRGFVKLTVRMAKWSASDNPVVHGRLLIGGVVVWQVDNVTLGGAGTWGYNSSPEIMVMHIPAGAAIEFQVYRVYHQHPQFRVGFTADILIAYR